MDPPVLPEPRRHPLSQFFDPLRQTRRRRYAAWRRGEGSTKRRAVLTIVHNEPVFLPIWLGYYSRFFAPDDIYVLDNDSTDGSTDREGFVRIPVAHDQVDHTWMVRTIEGHQQELLDCYDAVLVTDVDEIVAPDPAWGTLADYIDRFDEEFVNCLGYEVLHLPGKEQPLRLDRPILEQRAYWFINDAYDKPALATTPMSWEPGFHSRSDGEVNWDPDLRLVHLHRIDYDICRIRHRERRQRAWNDRDVNSGWAAHNRLTDGDAFDRWFFSESGFEDRGIEIVLEPIPERWRALL